MGKAGALERDEFEPISKAEEERMPVKDDSHHAAGMKGNEFFYSREMGGGRKAEF